MLLINPYRFAAPFDPTAALADAAAYIAAVETADGQSLEQGVKDAYEDFIVGLHQDGIWSAIKSACILAGARTLDGALVPLVGSAPTNNNFVSGDYDREDGLKGNGSTKYLDSNRAENADPQDDNHIAANVTFLGSGNRIILGGFDSTLSPYRLTEIITNYGVRSRSLTAALFGPAAPTFVGNNRNNGSTAEYRAHGSTSSYSSTSLAPGSKTYYVFARNSNGTPAILTESRLSFYSIGESLDLADLDARVSTLMTDIAAAIP